jgi:hypothetical protein
MYMVDILDGSGRRTSVDLHLLQVADGSRAFDYLAEPNRLFNKLKAMKTPEIRADMGSIDLMLCLARFIAANPKGPPIHRREHPNTGDSAA